MKQNVGLEEEGTITGGRGITLSSAQPGRRPAGINTVEDPVDENTHESNKDGEGEEEELQLQEVRQWWTERPRVQTLILGIQPCLRPPWRKECGSARRGGS
ncbi:hypothetical protein J4Q44_G00248610 [Coregonus suidteri]|uniref:Uncharacterized protein n=1 Tax=Coregonus suidteri TaxID=861788 RepID=A0AAN8L898_9TELE